MSFSAMMSSSAGVILVGLVAIAWTQQSTDPTVRSVLLSVSACLCGGILYLWWHTRSDALKQKDDGKNTSAASTAPLKKIWNTGSTNATGSGSSARSNATTDKPFGSKYYYAHNDPSAKGGYKDGLRMEDYTMNGPRLLSKNGQPIQESDGDRQQEMAELSNPREEITQSKPTASTPAPTSACMPITKYLWDDPGDYKGIATIRIDRLSEKVLVESVRVVNTEATILEGDGLRVRIETNQAQAATYELYLRQLYGPVDSVKVVVKSKRVLVRLFKRKKTFLLGSDTSNLQAWPHPHKKI